MRWIVSAVALIVLAVGGAIVWKTAFVPRADVLEGTVQPVSPAGTVDAVTEFSWRSNVRADRYRVRVTRGADSVFYGETAALRISASPELFEPGVEYRWSVEVVDSEGDVRMTSPPQTFRIK